MTFGELMEALEVSIEPLQEFLTYDKLFRMSEPKRFQRSLTVKMPPLDMEQYQTGGHWVFGYYFNAKGNPSTTGLRHRGYVRFKKPKKSHTGKTTPLSQLPVEVDCMCPDYRYRWAWANHQRRAGPIGAGSLNQCINKAPRKTNPKGAPGLCKHILATRDYIYGLLSGFPKSVGATDRLDKLTKRATRRWLNFDAEMDKARERDAKIAMSKARRNLGIPPENQGVPITPELPPDFQVGPKGKPQPKEPKTVPTGKSPEQAVPTKAPTKGPVKGSGKAPVKPSKLPPLGNTKQLSPRQFLANRFMKVEGVDSMTNMKTLTLQEAQVVENAFKLINELADDMERGPEEMGPEGMDDMPPPSGEEMPMEPPVSDTAVGASTGDNVALSLLREIRDLLADIKGEEQGEVPGLPGEEEGEGETEPEPGSEGEEELEGSEEFKPGKRPMPVASGAGE
jgi:hypothetical protein